jgi:hypothetical protein
MALTGDAEGTGAAVCGPGGIEHPYGPIMFGASFLRIERSPLPTTQRTIRLREKVVAPQAAYSCWTRPLRRTEGGSSWGAARSWPRFRVRGGQTR